MNDRAIDAGVRMGHVHLKVADLERALGFYRGVLGFQLMQRFGDSAAFISAGGLPPPYRAEYVGEQGRDCSASRDDGAVPPGDCVSDTRGSGRRLAAADAGRRAARWGRRPWGERGALPARSGRKRSGVVLGPAAGGVAERCSRRVGDVHQSAGSARTAGGGESEAGNQALRTIRPFFHRARTTSI